MVIITWIAMHFFSSGQRNGSNAGQVKGRAEVRRGVVARMMRPLIMVSFMQLSLSLGVRVSPEL